VSAKDAAATAILDGEGRLLLVREGYDRHRYTFPGGALEPGESPLDAVIRERREETGVTVEVDHVVGIYRLVGGLAVFLFRCSREDGEPGLPKTGGIAEVNWVAPDEIPEPSSNLLHHSLEDVVENHRGVVRDRLPRIN
jgi:8-oxo-dGTP diphosphatase